MIKGIIFDLDGTLVDSLSDLANSVNRVLGRAGFPIHPVDDYRLMIGNGMAKLVLRALPDSARNEANQARVKAEVEREYDGHCLDLTRPYPGIESLITGLRGRSVPLAILSNKPDAFTRRIASALFPQAPFEIVRGQSEAFPTKPDPASSLDIARQWGIDPASMIFLGDSEVDIRTGLAAGMKSLGAGWGFRGREELEQAGAQGILTEPGELLAWL